MKRNQSDHSLLSLKEYGVITLKLKELMALRQINRNQLARLIDVRFEVINKWYNNDLSKLDLDILARICSVLDCSIVDLLEYHPANVANSRDKNTVAGTAKARDKNAAAGTAKARGKNAVAGSAGSYLRVAETPAGTYDTTH